MHSRRPDHRSRSTGSEQKVAIVTGASQGIGAGLVEGFRASGYAVAADSRGIAGGADEGIVAVPGDIAERDTAERVVRTALDRFGRIDTLVNNAGIFIGKPSPNTRSRTCAASST